MKDYRKAKKLVDVSVGEAVRIISELQEMSQNALSELTGIHQCNISLESLSSNGAKGFSLQASSAMRNPSPCKPRIVCKWAACAGLKNKKWGSCL
mgnify:CR=1 FL=1